MTSVTMCSNRHSQLSTTAYRILAERYLLKNESGMETPEDMFRRVAEHVASAENEFSPDCRAKVWLRAETVDAVERYPS